MEYGLDNIRRGDVILYNGRPRTVRAVKHRGDRLWCATFAKLRRSRFVRPTTTLFRADLAPVFGGVIAHRKDADTLCATETECRVQHEVDDRTLYPGDLRITQDEAVGVVW